MGIGSSNLWQTLGAGVGQWGGVLSDAVERRRLEEERMANRAQDVAFRDKQFDTSVDQWERQFGRQGEQYGDQLTRQDLLSGVVGGPDGLSFDPSRSAAMQTEAYKKDNQFAPYYESSYERALADAARSRAAGGSSTGRTGFMTDDQVFDNLRRIMEPKDGQFGKEPKTPEEIRAEYTTLRPFLGRSMTMTEIEHLDREFGYSPGGAGESGPWGWTPENPEQAQFLRGLSEWLGGGNGMNR